VEQLKEAGITDEQIAKIKMMFEWFPIISPGIQYLFRRFLSETEIPDQN
jgi:hypothetical protein